MPYEHDAPAAYEEPRTRPPSRVTRWWWSLPRTGTGLAIALVLVMVAWVTGVGRGAGRLWVPLACLLLGEGTAWLFRKRRA